MTTLNFSAALDLLKAGNTVARTGWNGRGMWLKIQPHTSCAVFSGPFITLITVNRLAVPWTASQTDLLADDWELIHEREGW